MRLFRRSKDKDPTVAHIGAMVHRGADVQSAFQMALGGLSSQQQVDTLLGLVREMPPSARALFLGDAILSLGSENWERTKATLSERERRAEITQALIEESKQTKAVELGSIVAGTEVSLFLATSEDRPFPDFNRYMNSTDSGAKSAGQINLEARGMGEFILCSKIDFYTNDGVKSWESRPVSFKENTVVQVRSGHVRRESQTNLRFGDAVFIRGVTEPESGWERLRNITHLEDKVLYPSNTVHLTGMQLDGQLTMYRGMFRD